MGVIRDAAENEPMIVIPRERHAFFTHTGGMVESPDDDPLAYIRVKKEPVGAGAAPAGVQFE
jgi:hypothetical protein